MNRDKYKKDLEAARVKLALRERERAKVVDELDTKIAELRRDIRALALLAGEPEGFSEGLTNACLDVYRIAGKESLTPAQVQARLKQSGFPVTEYSNLLATITTTLRRMLLRGTLEVDPNVKDTRAYRLVR